MPQDREGALRFAARQNLGALKSEAVVSDRIVCVFEGGTVESRLPSNAKLI